MSIQQFAKQNDFKFQTENSRSYGGGTSVKKSLIKYIDKEIEILNERDDLTIKYKTNSKGESLDIKEIRGWRQSVNDSNIANVSLRLKNKIFGFGGETDRHTPTYFQCDYNKESVLELLNNLKKSISKMDENDDLLKLPTKK